MIGLSVHDLAHLPEPTQRRWLLVPVTTLDFAGAPPLTPQGQIRDLYPYRYQVVSNWVKKGVYSVPSFQIERGAGPLSEPHLIWLFMEIDRDKYLRWNAETLRRLFVYLLDEPGGEPEVFAIPPLGPGERFRQVLQQGYEDSGKQLSVTLLVAASVYAKAARHA